MSGYLCSIKANAMDLSSNYAVSLLALVDGLGSLTGIVGSYMVGILTPNTSLVEWITVFWIIFGVLNVSNVIFVVWGSGKTQRFNDRKVLRFYNDQPSKGSNRV